LLHPFIERHQGRLGYRTAAIVRLGRAGVNGERGAAGRSPPRASEGTGWGYARLQLSTEANTRQVPDYANQPGHSQEPQPRPKCPRLAPQVAP
jgi:hypothetical protein